MIEYMLMKPQHVGQVAQLEKTCFADPWSENAVRSELDNPLSVWIVATDENRVTGYVGSQAVLGEADMMNIAVAPDYRRKGIAEGLISALTAELKQQEVHCLTLEVRVSNVPAISLYSKLGFCQVGRRPNYYSKPKEDALILRKEWVL